MRYILTFLILSVSNYQENKEILTGSSIIYRSDVDTSYNYSINIIKKWEKFSPVRYNLFGDTYIGYGHLLKKSDTISIINEFMADSLLKCDFDKALRCVNYYLPKMARKKRMVLANFVFNCGIGTFKKSELLRLINHNSPDSTIETQYYKYVYAGKIKLPKLLNRRKDEFLIWRPSHDRHISANLSAGFY